MGIDPALARVTLRPPVDDDASVHANRVPSAEIHRMFGGRGEVPAPNIEQSKGWLVWMRSQDLGRIIEADGQPIGEVRLHSLSEADKSARLAVGIWNERDLNRGIGRQAVRQALQIAFDTMHLHRVDLRVLAINQRAIRCYLACGFVHEGTLRQAALLNETWHDDWIMAILAPEFEQNHQEAPRKGTTIPN